MKRILYAIAALVTTILVAGCARELAPNEVAGETVTATFTVGTPGFATKALSDGSKVDEFIFAVYDESGNYLQELTEAATVTGANPTWSVSVPVVKDLTYQFLFVAKKSVASTSTTGDIWTVDVANKTLSIDYSKVAANEDDVDLFYASIKETIGDQLSKTVGLSRPLAQVNVGAADLTAAALSFDVANMTTGFTIEGIYNTIDLLTGKVPTNATAVDVTFAPVARINEGTTEFYTGYKRIALAHVLVGEKQNSTVTFKAVAGSKTVEREVANVPLQQNYRTNILGNIFTSNMAFTVNVEAGFATPDYNVIISSQEDLDAVISAINAGTSTAPSLDIDVDVDGTVLDFSGLTAPLTIPVTVSSPAANEEPKTVVIENLEATQSGAGIAAVTVDAGAKLIIEDSELTSTGENPRGLFVEKDAEVEINGTTIDAHGSNNPRALQINDTGAKVTVKDSEIKAGHYPINLLGASGTAEIVMENTTVDGWCVLNIWSSGNNFVFKNCVLISTNDKTYDANGWNDFSAVIFNNDSSNKANNNSVLLKDCTTTVKSTTNNKQSLVSIRYLYTQAMYDAGEGPIFLSGNSFIVDGGSITGIDTNTNWYDNQAAVSLTNTDDNTVDFLNLTSFVWNNEDLLAD